MDTLTIEATQPKPASAPPGTTSSPAPTPAKRKPAKKAKKAVVFFEVEILDAKTKDKLCFLDKVRASGFYFPEHSLIQKVLQLFILTSRPGSSGSACGPAVHVLSVKYNTATLGLGAMYSFHTRVLRHVWCSASYSAMFLWRLQQSEASTHCQG